MHKLYRLLRYDWALHFILLLTNWLPDNVVFLRLRGALARRFLGSCGGNLRLGRNVTFYNPSKIHVGKNVYVAFGCWFGAGDSIFIADEVIFGPFCVIASEDHTRHHESFRYGKMRQAPVKIGRGCWLASQVIVTAGSDIGEGSLIAAGAVVTDAIPPQVVAGGIPARVLKELPGD